ncbi:hypothetical protein ACFUCV_14465 [Specibacter sp. NPDC057265]|uniref:hypothetical protein n=1 Tax=Specibacter sp. NPDC057265 TaxID=3346075 RepID=UPI003645F108
MWFFLSIALLLLGFGVAKFIAALRQGHSQGLVVTLVKIREASIASNFVFLSGICVVTGLPASSVGTTIVTVLCVLFVFGLIMVRTMSTTIKRASELNAGSLAELLRRSWFLVSASGKEWAKNIQIKIAPQGWGEIRPRSFNLDEILSVRNFIWIYIFFLFLTPPLLAIFLVQQLKSSTDETQGMLTAVIGVNVLLMASCVTVAVILYLLVIAVLRHARVLQFRLDWKSILSRVAGFVGAGTALGGFTAALIPIVSYVFPASESLILDQAAVVATISPQLFFDLPAAGAVGGYIFGMLGIPAGIWRNATNLIYAHLLGPLTFILISVMLSANGLSPASIFERAAVAWQRTSGGTCLSEKDLETMLGSGADPTSVLLAADGCQIAVVISDDLFVGMVIGVVAAWSVAALLWQSLNPWKRSASNELYEKTDLSDP